MLSGSPPTAAGISGLSVHHSQSISGIDLIGNCSDPENDLLTVEIVTGPNKGWVSFNDSGSAFTYFAYGGNTGPDSFTFRAWDGESYSNEATVSLNITNTVPTASNLGTFSVTQGQAVADIDLNGAVFDPDNDPISTSIVTGPSHGWLSYDSAAGTYDYYAYGEYVGVDSFTFRGNDGAEDSNLATVTFNVSVSPYPAYLAAVDQADEAYGVAVASAFTAYAQAVATAKVAADSDAEAAYTGYLSAVSGSYDAYLAE